MYTVNVRAGLEAEKELLPNPTNTSLNSICFLLGHLTHTYFPSFSSKRLGVKM